MAGGPVARVRLARLGAIAEQAEGAGQGWLTEHEARRLQAMSAPPRRRSFLAGHWLARSLASAWLQIEPTRIGLHQHGDGRPYVQLDGAAVASLSLSHSGDWLACAIATVPVGVDVEVPRRRRDLDALAKFAFSPDEVESLRLGSEAGRSVEFHALWTLKEARGKQSGEGLLPGRSRRLTAMPSEPLEADASSWRLGNGALALAVAAGTDVLVEGGEPLENRRYWRFVET